MTITEITPGPRLVLTIEEAAQQSASVERSCTPSSRPVRSSPFVSDVFAASRSTPFTPTSRRCETRAASRERSGEAGAGRGIEHLQGF
jgi:hypothetical protein